MFSNKIRIVGLVLLAHYSQSFVLLTANIEDVRRLASKFVSESVARQIAHMISRAAGVATSSPIVSAENEVNEREDDGPLSNNDRIPKGIQRGKQGVISYPLPSSRQTEAQFQRTTNRGQHEEYREHNRPQLPKRHRLQRMNDRVFAYDESPASELQEKVADQIHPQQELKQQLGSLHSKIQQYIEDPALQDHRPRYKYQNRLPSQRQSRHHEEQNSQYQNAKYQNRPYNNAPYQRYQTYKQRESDRYAEKPVHKQELNEEKSRYLRLRSDNPVEENPPPSEEDQVDPTAVGEDPKKGLDEFSEKNTEVTVEPDVITTVVATEASTINDDRTIRQRSRTRNRNLVRFLDNKNNEMMEVQSLKPTFNLKLTTERERTEFDQYDDIKGKSAGTSGSIFVLSMDKWPEQSSVSRKRNGYHQKEPVQIAPVLISQRPFITQADDINTTVMNLDDINMHTVTNNAGKRKVNDKKRYDEYKAEENYAKVYQGYKKIRNGDADIGDENTPRDDNSVPNYYPNNNMTNSVTDQSIVV